VVRGPSKALTHLRKLQAFNYHVKMSDKPHKKAQDANPAAAATSLVTSQDLHHPSPNPSLSQGVVGEAMRLGGQCRFGEWVKSAELVMVMVPGSVEDELVFNILKYIHDPQRNRLHVQHLTWCTRGFKSSAFGVADLPTPLVQAKKHRGNRQTHTVRMKFSSPTLQVQINFYVLAVASRSPTLIA